MNTTMSESAIGRAAWERAAVAYAEDPTSAHARAVLAAREGRDLDEAMSFGRAEAARRAEKVEAAARNSDGLKNARNGEGQ